MKNKYLIGGYGNGTLTIYQIAKIIEKSKLSYASFSNKGLSPVEFEEEIIKVAIDGNKLNNKLNNLMLFPNESAHQKYHQYVKSKK